MNELRAVLLPKEYECLVVHQGARYQPAMILFNITMSFLVGFLVAMLPQATWAQMPPPMPMECSPSSSAPVQPVPLELEGVYTIEVESNEKIKLQMTLLKSIESEKMSLTFSRAGSNGILFFLSCVTVNKVSSQSYKIEASGMNFSGVRTFLDLTLDTDLMTVTGEISGNFLRDENPIHLQGKKVESIYEVYAKSTLTPCGAKDDLHGTYTGFFGDDKPATLNIFKFKKQNGDEGLSGNVISSINVLFHDGIFDPNKSLLSLVQTSSYSFSGKSKKLMLICSKDADHYILRGLHIASTGAMIRNVVFKKTK